MLYAASTIVSYALVRILPFALTVLCLEAQTADYDRARELLKAGKAAEAAEIFLALSRAQPENADLLLNLTITQYKAGHFNEAVASASAALNVNPKLVPARLFLGASYLETGKYEEAVTALATVVEAEPGERNGRLLLGEALLRAARPAEAIDQLNAASELLPANARVWYLLGRAYTAVQQGQAADAAWAKLASLPPSPESHMHAAEVHDAEHRWREAAVEWREALRSLPENRSARIGLAWSLFRSRDYEAARAVLEPLLQTTGPEAHFLYGASLLNQQQPVAAMPYLKSAIAANKSFASARAALGQALLQTGRAEQAIPLLRDALGVDEDGSIHFQLFRAYQLTNQIENARTTLGAFQRLRASPPAAAP